MPVIRRSVRLFTALLCLLASAPALAQNAQLTLYVFNEGAPVENIEILLDGELIGLTNVHGRSHVELPPGIHYLELRLQDSVVLEQQILSVADEVSQWIVDVTGGGSAIYDVESSRPELAGAGAAASAEESNLAPGVIEGRLVSADDGRPIENARVFISGVSSDIRSDAEGRFSAGAPAGLRSVSVLHSGFNTLTRDNIEVTEGGTASLDLELTPAGSEMPEFVVIAPYISGSLASVMAERRDSDGVTDVLSAEQISRAGDSDVAGALRRVTGLTLVNGRYIYVRGLGERYSSVLLNNAMIPSPDPTRRVVPLDLFPTDVIEAVVVQKTASPNLPGEFGGGTVLLRTIAFPAELTAKLNGKIGYREYTTGKDGLTYDGGGTDWLGKDDGTRAMPDSLAEATADGEFLRPRSFTNPDGFSPEEIEMFGEDVATKSSYDVYDKTLPPNLGLSGAIGDSYEFGKGNRWGFMGAFKYDNSWVNVQETRKTYSAIASGGLQLKDDIEVYRTVNFIDLSGFANVGVEFAQDQNIGFNAMLLRQASDQSKISQGIEENQNLQRYELQWIENQLVNYQLLGSHVLPFKEWSIDWQYTDATATRDEPNTRNYRRDDDNDDGEYLISTRSDSNSQSWSYLKDNMNNWSVDSVLPLTFGSHGLALGGGLADVQRDRDASIRTFTFQGNRIPQEALNLSWEEFLSPEFIGPNGLQLKESTRATDTYTATQSLDALYFNLDLSLYNEKFRISAGAREEDNQQEVVTNDLSNPSAPPVVGSIDQTDWLPSTAFTWAYSASAQFRLAYAESLNRPDFREMSPAPYLDPLLDLITVGNPNLVTASLKNYDARWEYYFSPSESFSLAAFYKDIANPIEKTLSSGGSGQIITLQNALGATLYGAEVDYYQSLDWVRNHDWLNWLEDFNLGFIGPFDWDNFFIAFNFAWIESNVEIDSSLTTQTNADRPLQGQSPWVVNLQFGYSNPEGNTEWTVLFNEFGERISQAGVLGQPDIYEQPIPQLNFVYKRSFAEHWLLTLKLKNLLNPDVEFTQGTEITRTFRPGREFSAELKWAF